MSGKVDWYGEELLIVIDGASDEILTQAAFYAEGQAKIREPVDTGFMRAATYGIGPNGSQRNEAGAQAAASRVMAGAPALDEHEAALHGAASYTIYQEMRVGFMYEAAQAVVIAPEATAVPTIAPDPQGGVTVILRATEHVWVRVTADDRIAYVGFLAPDEAKGWSAQEGVLVETGNGAGLQLSVNGQPQGLLGERGVVARRAWGPTGEVEPA